MSADRVRAAPLTKLSPPTHISSPRSLIDYFPHYVILFEAVRPKPSVFVTADFNLHSVIVL